MIRAAVIAILLTLSAAQAAEVVDQSNDRFAVSPAIPTHAIGGASRQELAQTFTVGLSGPLVKLRLPLACESGELTIDIVALSAGLPTGASRGRTTVAATSVRRVHPTPPSFIDIALAAPIAVTAGERLAFVLRNATGECAVSRAEAGETYAAGDGYFISLPDGPSWRSLDLDGILAPDPADHLFQTAIDAPAPPPATSSGCIVLPGSGGRPVDLPICRCLRDEGLREFRCALLNPDFFAIRRIPWPLPLDTPYTETWEVLPLTKLKGPIGVKLEGANISKPIDLSFAGKSQRVLISRPVKLSAPAKAADIKGLATISYGGGSFQLDTSLPAGQFAPGKKP
ncbi:MAG: hypothetical protein ABL957_04710 [Parvularculaceae bacterium]